jgi:hypothetical protein
MSDRYAALLAELRAEDSKPPDEVRRQLAGPISATLAGRAGRLGANLVNEVLSDLAADERPAAAGTAYSSPMVALLLTLVGIAVCAATGALSYGAVVGRDGDEARDSARLEVADADPGQSDGGVDRAPDTAVVAPSGSHAGSRPSEATRTDD